MGWGRRAREGTFGASPLVRRSRGRAEEQHIPLECQGSAALVADAGEPAGQGTPPPSMASPPGAPAASLPLDGSVVKMKGLPFKATADDVMRFYSGFTLKADSVFLRRHPDGRPNGEVSSS